MHNNGNAHTHETEGDNRTEDVPAIACQDLANNHNNNNLSGGEPHFYRAGVFTERDLRKRSKPFPLDDQVCPTNVLTYEMCYRAAETEK